MADLKALLSLKWEDKPDPNPQAIWLGDKPPEMHPTAKQTDPKKGQEMIPVISGAMSSYSTSPNRPK